MIDYCAKLEEGVEKLEKEMRELPGGVQVRVFYDLGLVKVLMIGSSMLPIGFRKRGVGFDSAQDGLRVISNPAHCRSISFHGMLVQTINTEKQHQ